MDYLSRYVAFDDLFVIGLALDITGAALLAKGLLESPKTIRREGGTYVGFNSATIVGLVRDRVDAEFGMAALLLGFTIQALAYVLLLGGVVVNDPGGSSEALAAVAMGLLGAGSVVGLYFLVRRTREKRLLIRVTKREGEWTRQTASELHGIAITIYPAASDEDAPAYLRRVFSVEVSPDLWTNET